MKALLLCLTLSGCASAQIDHALSNLDKDCVRHYAGAFSTLQTTVTFDITCQPAKQ